MHNNNSLVINSIYNVIYKLLNVLFPLLTATYVSRALLASGVGKVSLAQNIVAYFTTIAALGIPNYGTREIAKRRDDLNLTSKTFSELFIINFFSTSCCLILYYLLIINIDFFKPNLLLYCIVGLTILFNYINVDWFYQGIEKYKYITKRSLFVKCICLICILFFVKKPEDYINYALIYCLGIGGNNIFNIINLKRNNIKLQFRNINIKAHLKPIFILLASVIAIELYTMLDTTMIGLMSSEENVGYYTNSMKIVKILIGVITAIGGVLLPRLSYYSEKKMIDKCSEIVNKVFLIMIYLFVPCEIGLLFISNQVVPILFGMSFYQSITTLKIASLLICTLGFSNLFGTQVLLTFREEKKLLLCTIIGAILNVFLNSILIPKFTQNGAAVASVMSETLVTGLAIYFSSKYIKIRIDLNFMKSLIISSICMSVVIFMIQRLNIQDMTKMLASITIGSMTYIGTSILTKNFIFKDIKDLINSRKEI